MPTTNLPPQTRNLAYMFDREQMWRDPMGLEPRYSSSLSTHQRDTGHSLTCVIERGLMIRNVGVTCSAYQSKRELNAKLG